MKNNYKIDNNTVIIYCQNRKQEKFQILIDTKNFEKINSYDVTWYAHWKTCTESYYATATLYLGKVNGRPKYKSLEMQRVILPVRRGYRPDHINHDTMDNREDNLRVSSYSENLRNRNGKNSNNKSGCRNVCWTESCHRWLVQFQVDKKNKCFGRFKFEDKEKAIELANKLRIELYKEFAGNN